MTARDSQAVEQTWQEFHNVVNLTSRELGDWLGSQDDLAPRPGPKEPPPLGTAVLSILRKRKVDLTDDDLAVMTKVVDIVRDETDGISDQELTTDERRRRRLLNIGHDPLRASL